MSKKILILGAGYAGIQTALVLQKKKKKQDDIEISIIDKNPYHTLLTELHEVAGNRISEDGVIVPLKDIFKYTDVKIIQDNISRIDFNGNKLISDEREYKYDYLVIALGSEPNYYGIPGMEENCFPLWSLKDAIAIREHIKECFRKAANTNDPLVRRKLLTFVIGGGGFTGVEMAGELAQWKKLLCKEYGIPQNEPEIILVEALPRILSALKESNSKKAMNYLVKKLNVKVLLNSAITSLTPDEVQLKDMKPISTNTLIWTAGVKANGLSEILDISKGKAGRIEVNEYTQTQYENVYSVGDVSAFNAGGKTLPALVESALQTGEAAALNILASIRKQEKKKLEPKLRGVMVSIGSFFAVSDIMSVQYPRLISIMLKYFVNMHYLFGIGGFELVLKYLRHEFFEKRQEKFLIEKHYSVKTQAFWLVPIRIFLGYAWLTEGINKIKENWLVEPLLAGAQLDGNTSASVTETGEKVFRIVSDHTPSWYAWIAENIVVPNAMFFQVLIVLAEIGLGLAFITGTFTFLAGIAALGLNINFILSTGLYSYNWWFIPAAMCMLGGAGRAFGVDYYLIPYLMRQWRYFVRNRKIKLTLFRE